MSMTITDEFDNADPATILDQLTDFVTAKSDDCTSCDLSEIVRLLC